MDLDKAIKDITEENIRAALSVVGQLPRAPAGICAGLPAEVIRTWPEPADPEYDPAA